MKNTTVYILIIICLLSIACKPDSPIKMVPKDPDPATYQYLALGDSYTIGERVEEKKRWPVQLADSLLLADFDIASPKIIARTGWTTDELKVGIASENPSKEYDLVSLLIGVNNQFRGRGLGEYKIQFKELLTLSIEFARGDTSRVFVLSIPDYGATPYGQSNNPDQIGKEIDLFNETAKVICETYGIPFFDITGISREAKNDPSLVAVDGLHPSGKMYTRWVEKILPEVVKILQ